PVVTGTARLAKTLRRAHRCTLPRLVRSESLPGPMESSASFYLSSQASLRARNIWKKGGKDYTRVLTYTGELSLIHNGSMRIDVGGCISAVADVIWSPNTLNTRMAEARTRGSGHR